MATTRVADVQPVLLWPGLWPISILSRNRSGTAPAPEQGLGLGLSFVAWIVKAHKGTIDADSSRSGRGTRFSIRLPSAGVGADTLELTRPSA